VQMLWCWRCKSEVPMVDEKEWNALLRKRRDAPVLREYERLTGGKGGLKAKKQMLAHRRSNYGEACPRCGRLFRTPRVRFCAKCGFRPARPAGLS
jgi:ribosomal protein L37E